MKMKKIWNWLKDHHARNARERQARLEAEAIDRITVRDYRGDLYIAFDGRPLVNVADLLEDWDKALDKSRGTYCNWRADRR